MAKYQFEWTRERWLRVVIEAENQEQAEQKFWGGDYDNEQQFGEEIQPDIDIKEITND